MTQDEALSILKAGGNVFLTGEPGSGKTHTVNRYVKWLRAHDIEPAITASTGIAATHIGGFTIHSWSGIGVKRYLTPHDLDAITQNKRVAKRIANVKVLIIDEVSMLAADTLTMVEAVCREVRQDQRPFGGLQTVFVGDFFQLPPVVRRAEQDQQRTLGAEGEALFAFDSPAWQQLNPLVCYLAEQHRQDDQVYLDLLSAIRQGSVAETHRALLRTRYRPEPEDGVTQLYSHNADVDTLNDQELKKLSSTLKTFEASQTGPEHLVSALKRGCLSPEVLTLKVDARVMFTKNDVVKHAFVNGTTGVITGFDDDTGHPIVRTSGKRRLLAEPMEWVLEDGGQVLASITQVPLRLAWAITVHKSQGMSLDAAHMDLSKTFEYGQGYVALSRVRTLKGLSLSGLNVKALEVHPDIREQDELFRRRSHEVRDVFTAMSTDELKALEDRFILACGGSLEAKPVVERKRAETPVPSHEITKELLLKHLPLRAVARERGLAVQTIVTHVEKLAAEKKIDPVRDLAHLKYGKEDVMDAVHDALRALGPVPLKSVYQKLQGRVPYDTIRIARLLFKE